MPAKQNTTAPLDAYRGALATAWKQAVFPFTAPYGRELGLSPADIYITPWLEITEISSPSDAVGECPIYDPVSTLETRRGRAASLLDRHGENGLVVLGEPGAGKSTLSRYLACATLDRGALTPILLPVTTYASLLATAPATSLPDAAAAYWCTQGVAGLAPTFAAALEQGQALVVLDGLDEAGSRAQRRALARRIAADMTRWRIQGNQWLLTSRPQGYGDAPLPAPNVTQATLCAWDTTQIREAVRGWCRALARWKTGTDVAIEDPSVIRHATSLRDTIEQDDALLDLARSPLSLALLVLIEHARNELPSNRARLYEAYADELLQRRPKRSTAHALDPSEFLIPLALWLQCEHPFGRVSAEGLADECMRIALRYEGYLRAEDAPADIHAIAAAVAREFYTPDRTEAAGGILTEVSPGDLAFAHRALQDFYVGRALARMPSDRRWELLRPRLHAARWREPLLLCVGWLAAVERRREEVDILCRQILTAQSSHENLLARDTRLAIAVATRSAGLVRHQLLSEMKARIDTFSAAMPSYAGRLEWIEKCTALAKLGLRDAETTIRNCLEDGFPALKRVTLIALRKHLDGANAQHLRSLALKRLRSDDSDERHIAWHILLPFWNRFAEVQAAMLADLDANRGPSCGAALLELAHRAIESPPAVMRALATNVRLAPWIVTAKVEAGIDLEQIHEDLRTVVSSDSAAAELIAWHMATRLSEPSIRAEVERLLHDPIPQVRRRMLLGIGSPRQGEAIAEYITTALSDEDPEVQDLAQRISSRLVFHLPFGLDIAKVMLSNPDSHLLAAQNLRAEWWSDLELRGPILSLFSPDNPELAIEAFRSGFPHIFLGQPELVDIAIKALHSEALVLREPVLVAMEPFLPTVPRFVTALIDNLRHNDAGLDRARVFRSLQRVIDASYEARLAICDFAANEQASVWFREHALACLGHIAHHDRYVWDTVRTIVELGATDRDTWSVVSAAHGILLHLAGFLPGETLRRGIVYLNGHRAGLLEETPTGTRFSYDDAWLSAPGSLAISLTMPLRAQPYESVGLHAFFDNMLPEGWLLERVSLAEKLDKRDRLGLLLATGSDTIGAVSVIPDSAQEDDA